MSRVKEFLGDKSQIGRLLQAVESGAPVDLRKEQRIQALTLVRIGELFALDAIEAEEATNGRFAEQ